MVNESHLERLTKIKHGECDICGEFSVMLTNGVCQKQVCQRHVEEGKGAIQEKIVQSENLAKEYAGQGYE